MFLRIVHGMMGYGPPGIVTATDDGGGDEGRLLDDPTPVFIFYHPA
jgi:hypothetical protein